jgi:tRNA A-37 threonylcarbamoyl transferase component Bud32
MSSSNIDFCVPLKKRKVDYSLKKEIGLPSAFGVIYQVCKMENCDYILKFQSDRFDQEKERVTKEMIENEIRLQNLAASIKISIPIIDYWFCKNGSVIIMKKLDMELEKLIYEKYLNNEKKLFEIYDKVIDKINILHKKLKINHNDLHLGNIMIDKNENIYFIDFGNSYILGGKQITNENEYSYNSSDYGIIVDVIEDTIKDDKLKDILLTKIEINKIDDPVEIYLKKEEI